MIDRRPDRGIEGPTRAKDPDPIASAPRGDEDGIGALQPLALRARDAARLIGIGERHLWSLTRSGQVPHVRLGNAVVYPLDQLREWLADRARASTRRRGPH